MFDYNGKAADRLNLAEYMDKAAGCWMGKNIGGTLGGPYEGQQAMQDVSFYPESIQGKALPNDDLDLQLVWLRAMEDVGVVNVNERVLGEYWLNRIVGPWNEYGVCKANLRAGFTPPLSGACNNERWYASNGAWIRSEIWACVFPGAPDEAAMYAYYDACCDHYGDGIYAELFTAALESAAFVENNVDRLIDIALKRIPADCRVARSIQIVRDGFAAGKDYREVRNEVVKGSEDLGWFQAPANVAFTVIAILYGRGDFGKTVCIATNCGDDTDCTAGTAGAVLGIMLGRSGIPQKWVDPIGDGIVTGSITNYVNDRFPDTIQKLTERVKVLAQEAQMFFPAIPSFTDGKTAVSPELQKALDDGSKMQNRVWNRDPYCLTQDLPCGRILCFYKNGPYAETGKKLTLSFAYIPKTHEQTVSLKLELPEGWSAAPAAGCVLLGRWEMINKAEIELTPGTLPDGMTYLKAEIACADRLVRYPVCFPLQSGPCRAFVQEPFIQEYFDTMTRKQYRN